MKAFQYLLFITCLCLFAAIASGQRKQQQGLVLKSGTGIRLGSISVIDKHNKARTTSNLYGIFSIEAEKGDTLWLTGENFMEKYLVVSDFTDRVIYLVPSVQLSEVVIKENPLKADIKETQLGYRRKSVFYTGTPHYYYLVLKPMTFIYENFKSEVKQARHFNRYAKAEIASSEINRRFSDVFIKKTVPIKDEQLEQFKAAYTPALKQLNGMDDYELIEYTKKSFNDFLSDAGVK